MLNMLFPFQTPQDSDALDKKYNVRDDIFEDALDLHATYRRANYYGPVLFVLKLELLRKNALKGLLDTPSIINFK